MRITTWNVNGIRNPFGYQPWRDRRTFEGMFDILEADIVVFQETKIQRKDLRDDMVLVPGWDCYWSLPRHKKGYSGVVIYTRNSVCAPIRAEEGIAGVLYPPNSRTSFCDLPEDQQIGGYPTIEQLSQSEVDAATLDSEGRCVLLEFPAFVLIGVYCPANRDESRDNFRLGFLNLLDSRIRNLVKMGKRVIVTGDINISREELDTAAAEETMRKNAMTPVEYYSTQARRLFNQLLLNGQVFGPRDEGRENAVMCDVTREFHPTRKGMYTCWDTKVNARPGNYGARIDYLLCSLDMKDWFSDSNIQEGLMGSDHCPVYATIQDEINIGGTKRHILDIMNPSGMFQNGKRVKEWTSKNLLPMSGKLIPEFDRRQSIRDMFTRKPTLPKDKSTTGEDESDVVTPKAPLDPPTPLAAPAAVTSERPVEAPPASASPTKSALGKRSMKAETSLPALKKSKSGSSAAVAKGQQSLAGFFKPKSAPLKPKDGLEDASAEGEISKGAGNVMRTDPPLPAQSMYDELYESTPPDRSPKLTRITSDTTTTAPIDPDATKQSWGNLMRKPVAPNCEHDEPCKTMQTKKPGINCGRSFWMCARPLGPSGQKEKGTQWRCGTFIWASDWTGIQKEQAAKAKDSKS